MNRDAIFNECSSHEQSDTQSRAAVAKVIESSLFNGFFKKMRAFAFITTLVVLVHVVLAGPVDDQAGKLGIATVNFSTIIKKIHFN